MAKPLRAVNGVQKRKSKKAAKQKSNKSEARRKSTTGRMAERLLLAPTGRLCVATGGAKRNPW